MSRFTVHTAKSMDTKTSRFLVTINTQRAYTDVATFAKAKREFRDELEALYADIERYLDVYRETDKHYVKLRVSRSQLDQLIVRGDIEQHMEVGARVHRLHSHALVTIEHDPSVVFRMNLKAMRASLSPSYHLDVKFIRDQAFSIRRYVRKSVAS